jgi:hypothetical protein
MTGLVPQQLGTSGAQRNADRLASLERRLAALERGDGVPFETAYPDAWTSYTVAHDAIAAPQGNSHGPQAIYDLESNTTYFTYRGRNGDHYVSSVNHETGAIEAPVNVGSFPSYVTRADSHGQAAIALDGNGYIHVCWAAHNSEFQWAKSPAARQVSGTWTTTTLAANGGTPVAPGTYVSMAYDDVSNAIYAIYRAGMAHGNDPHGAFGTIPSRVAGDFAYPRHEHAALLRLNDGGSTWTDLSLAVGGIINTVAHADLYTDVYLPHISAYNGLLYITWIIAHGTAHDDRRGNLYAARYNPATGALTTMGGTALGTSIDWADHASCQVYANDGVGDGVAGGPHSTNLPVHYIDESGKMLVVLQADVAGTWQTRYSYWNGSAWSSGTLGAGIGSHDIYKDGSEWVVLRCNGANNNLEEWRSADGTTWAISDTVIREDEVSNAYGAAAVIVPKDSQGPVTAMWHDWQFNYLDPEVRIQAVTRDRTSRLTQLLLGTVYQKRQPKVVRYPYASTVASSPSPLPNDAIGVWRTLSIPNLPTNTTEVRLQAAIKTDGSDGVFEIAFRSVGISNDTGRTTYETMIRESARGENYAVYDLGWMAVNYNHAIEYRYAQSGESSLPMNEIVIDFALLLSAIKVN